MKKISPSLTAFRPRFAGVATLSLAAACLSLPASADVIQQTNLVSDIPGLAALTDPDLKNPWGVSHNATSPFWVSDQGAGLATLYNVTASGVSKLGLEVTIPTTPIGPQGPTGQVANTTSSFLVNGNPANFMFADLNGTILAWNGSAGTTAQVKVPSSGALYTGLALATTASGPLLYAANGTGNHIDVFDGLFAPVNLGPTAFVNPSAGALVPFNVQTIGGNILVTYAPAGRPAQVAAPEGAGQVAVFDLNGNFIRAIIGGKLASPWGMTLAPTNFGQFSGDLLVGNFSSAASEINAFDPLNGAFIGTIPIDTSGNRPGGLWGLIVGNGGSGGLTNTVYFADGLNGEADGLFGSLSVVPEPASTALLALGLFGVGAIRRKTRGN